MTVTIKVRPETEAELAHQAAQSGQVFDEYLSQLLEAAIHKPLPKQDPDFGRKLVEVFAMVRSLTEDVDFSRDKSTTWRPLELG